MDHLKNINARLIVTDQIALLKNSEEFTEDYK